MSNWCVLIGENSLEKVGVFAIIVTLPSRRDQDGFVTYSSNGTKWWKGRI